MEEQFGGNPWIKIISPKISPPSLKDNTADVDRLIKGIKKTLQTERISVDFSLAKNLPQTLRKCDYDVDAAIFEDQNGWHLIDIFPAHKENRIHGMAVDLGSSTVVARLVDLSSQEIRDEISFHPRCKSVQIYSPGFILRLKKVALRNCKLFWLKD